MCTVVVLRRPNHPWPLILGANRDENAGRAWLPPARHWPDRDHVVAGLDQLAGGTWLGVNDYGVLACVLNRPGTLGPLVDKRSRGELPLEALEHAEASVAAEALAFLDPDAYRPFNMVVADVRDAYWIASFEGARKIHVEPLLDGVSMLTAHDLNDEEHSSRQRLYRPQFEAATPPDPESGNWQEWQRLFESSQTVPGEGAESAMLIQLENGFATSSSSLIAIPKPGNPEVSAIWRFRGGPVGKAAWENVTF
jgi:uncharacterized protein with NRDE domain